VVFRATDAATGEPRAVKRMAKRLAPDGSMERYYVRRVRNEVDICGHLGRSLNVAYFYGAYEAAGHVDLVLELCTGGELWDRIKARGGQYNERDAARLVREMVRTVAQCHAQGVMVRDVKPENVSGGRGGGGGVCVVGGGRGCCRWWCARGARKCFGEGARATQAGVRGGERPRRP
jgi:serine/threonine protein kinase